jgi:amidohydrolase
MAEMNVNTDNKELDEFYSYIVSLRRELHRCPEVGFDLPETAAIVRRELDAMGIPHTDGYGVCSVVAEIGKGEDILALRADMDALPIEEQTGLAFASQNKGRMHACGHDSHTAVLLGVAKYLKAHESELKRRVRLIFQPAEESAVSDARMMVENGVMDGVGEVISTHCDNGIPVGEVGLCRGDYMAACIPATLTFFGKSAHATTPEQGIDAIAMAVECYDRLRAMVKEEAALLPFIWSVGTFNGGTAHNVICDRCSMDISFRFYDMDFAKRVEKRLREICAEVAASFGGRIDIVFDMSTGAVHNDLALCDAFEAKLKGAGVAVNAVERQMCSEDFGWYITRAKGLLFRFGTRNEQMGCTTALHTSNFMIDENGMRTAFVSFISYVLN